MTIFKTLAYNRYFDNYVCIEEKGPSLKDCDVPILYPRDVTLEDLEELYKTIDFSRVYLLDVRVNFYGDCTNRKKKDNESKNLSTGSR